MLDKRKSKRASISSIVRFKLFKSHLGMSSRGHDISENGLCFFALQRFELDLTLEVNFKLKETAKPINVQAKIVWQRSRDDAYYPFAIGLKFTKIEQTDVLRINEYVNKVSSGNSIQATFY